MKGSPVSNLRRARVHVAVALPILTILLAGTAGAQTLPAGWTVSNVGNPAISGAATFNGGTFSVSGAGSDVGGSSDQFTFVHRQVPGDTTFVARVASLQNVNGWSKAGVMIRESLAAGSKNAFAYVTPSHGLTFQRRTTTGGNSSQTNGGTGTAPVWLKLERRSTTVTAYRSANGTSWSQIGSATVSMTSTVYVGLAVTSRDAARTTTSTFTNVSEALPSGWTAADIGAPGVPGSTQYASSGATYTLNGSGEIGGTWDRFHFAYRQVTGDIDIRARVVSVQNIQPWSKAGVMVRETLNADAANGLMFITGVSGSAFHQRQTTGAMRVATEGTAVTPPVLGPVGAAKQPAHGVAIERRRDVDNHRHDATEQSDGIRRSGRGELGHCAVDHRGRRQCRRHRSGVESATGGFTDGPGERCDLYGSGDGEPGSDSE